jgi:hypothetical protein
MYAGKASDQDRDLSDGLIDLCNVGRNVFPQRDGLTDLERLSVSGNKNTS